MEEERESNRRERGLFVSLFFWGGNLYNTYIISRVLI